MLSKIESNIKKEGGILELFFYSWSLLLNQLKGVKKKKEVTCAN